MQKEDNTPNYVQLQIDVIVEFAVTHSRGAGDIRVKG
jgi:hypothetical protein